MNYLNWVDFIMVVIMAFGINSGRKSDFFTELIILVGVLFTTAFTLHYYVRFGHVLNDNLALPPNSQDVLAFIFIAAVMIGMTLLAKGGWLAIIKVNLDRRVDNWGSLIFSVIKSYFLCALVLFAMVISGFPSIENSSRKSYSFIIFKKAPLVVYSVCYTAFLEPFFSDEPLNQKAFRVIKGSR